MDFTGKLFNKLKRDNRIKVLREHFEFTHCDNETVARLLATIDSSSGAGVSCIATKVIKAASPILSPTLKDLFNQSIDSGLIPSD